MVSLVEQAELDSLGEREGIVRLLHSIVIVIVMEIGG